MNTEETMPPLVGYWDKSDLYQELQERERLGWYYDEELDELTKKLDNLNNDELREIHLRAGNDLIDDLPQSPMSYVFDVLRELP